jgi:hypothetical protein
MHHALFEGLFELNELHPLIEPDLLPEFAAV